MRIGSDTLPAETYQYAQMDDVFIILTTKGVHLWSRLFVKEERGQFDLIYAVVWALCTCCSKNGTRSSAVLRFGRVCALGGWNHRRLRASSVIIETRCKRSPEICCRRSRGARTRSRIDLTWRNRLYKVSGEWSRMLCRPAWTRRARERIWFLWKWNEIRDTLVVACPILVTLGAEEE